MVIRSFPFLGLLKKDFTEGLNLLITRFHLGMR